MALGTRASTTTSSSATVAKAAAAAAAAKANSAAATTTTTSSSCSDESTQVKVGHNAVTPNLRIILIRHGESENNIQYEISKAQYLANRQPDPPLTLTGQQQAKETAHYLASQQNAVLSRIERMYVSPFRRTLMTAHPIAKALNLKPMVWPDLYEVGGVHEEGEGRGGMTRTEIQKDFPTYQVDHESISSNGWYNVSLGKETVEQARARIAGVFRELQQQAMEATKDGTICLVVHGDFIDFLLQTALEWPSQGRMFPCWNTCISVLDIDKTGRPMLLMHNAVSHLSTVKTESLGKC